MKKIIGIIMLAMLVPAVISCRSDKPKPFLNIEQMSDLMSDIRLAEAHLYQTREQNRDDSDRRMKERAMDVYVPIFKKHGIDYKQFQALERYYMSHPEKMEKVLRKSAEKLKAMAADTTQQD